MCLVHPLIQGLDNFESALSAATNDVVAAAAVAAATNKAKVILDVTLCDALYKGAIKKGSAYPTEIHKKDLGSTFLNRMQVHHKVSRGT